MQAANVFYALLVYNDADEWETVCTLFKTPEAAVAFYNAEMQMFPAYEVQEMQVAA